jgi:hypothetical protein
VLFTVDAKFHGPLPPPLSFWDFPIFLFLVAAPVFNNAMCLDPDIDCEEQTIEILNIKYYLREIHEADQCMFVEIFSGTSTFKASISNWFSSNSCKKVVLIFFILFCLLHRNTM